MYVKINAFASHGIDTIPIEIEVNVASRGFPSFDIVGLPSKAIAESKDRVKTAIINSGFKFPNKKITINLAPANIPKEGSSYDLPIAVGILSIEKGFNVPRDALFHGELSLDGSLRFTQGGLLAALHAKKYNLKGLYLAELSCKGASVVDGVDVYPVKDLVMLARHLGENVQLPKMIVQKSVKYRYCNKNKREYDNEHTRGSSIDYVIGQNQAKRALQIAAAGGHNVLMTGLPGVGKSMLAKSFSQILPPLTFEESIEVTKIYSVSGNITPDETLITRRPFRSPHHTISYAGMIGGGNIPKPGEISLAHRGVLFLDEISEFSKSIIESLRQPIEDGSVTISRRFGSITYPSKFILIAAMNPCPCGYYKSGSNRCICTQNMIKKHNKKISGAILDRIDLHIYLGSLSEEDLVKGGNIVDKGKHQEIVTEIFGARERQKRRFKEDGVFINNEMNNELLSKYCVLKKACSVLMKRAATKFNLSARSYFRIIKVARTIADLDGSEDIESVHLAEAIQYRRRTA